jgi:hypothetical protein
MAHKALGIAMHHVHVLVQVFLHFEAFSTVITHDGPGLEPTDVLVAGQVAGMGEALLTHLAGVELPSLVLGHVGRVGPFIEEPRPTLGAPEAVCVCVRGFVHFESVLRPVLPATLVVVARVQVGRVLHAHVIGQVVLGVTLAGAHGARVHRVAVFAHVATQIADTRKYATTIGALIRAIVCNGFFG